MKPNRMPHQRNHHAISLENETALLVFESRCVAQGRIPDIVRFYQQRGLFVPMDRGRVFTAGSRRACCLVIKAKPGDLVSIAEPEPRKTRLNWLFLSIGEDFFPHVIESTRKLTYPEIHQQLLEKRSGLSGSQPLTIGNLRRLFETPNPPWLDSILSAQLDAWRLRDPAAFVNHTPSAPEPVDLDRGIAAAPSIILERWKNLLDVRRLERCIRLSPEAAVKYALSEIPNHLREEYLFEHAAIALDLWTAELSDSDWAACARALPKEVFERRMTLPSRVQACILAATFETLWMLPFLNPSSGERREVMKSILDHPDVWLSLHPPGFNRLFKKLDELAGVSLPNHELQSLMNHPAGSVRSAILEYIATRI
jgi:hypothetical protein